MVFEELREPGQQLYKQRVSAFRADIATQLSTPREVSGGPLTGRRLAGLMTQMAPQISHMKKMAVGALEAMENADRLQQMEEEKALMEEENAQMRERESSMKQQLLLLEEKDAQLQMLKAQLAVQEVETGKLPQRSEYSNANLVPVLGRVWCT